MVTLRATLLLCMVVLTTVIYTVLPFLLWIKLYPPEAFTGVTMWWCFVSCLPGMVLFMCAISGVQQYDKYLVAKAKK